MSKKQKKSKRKNPADNFNADNPLIKLLKKYGVIQFGSGGRTIKRRLKFKNG
jgi:hypothetical protein